MRLDARYTIALEHCGRARRWWVVRFCGEWVGCHYTPKGAHGIMLDHAKAREGTL